MRIDRKIDFADFVQRAVLLEELANTKGWHHVEISPARRGATTPQHRYYRGVVVPLAKAWLNETQGGDDSGADFDDTSAHEWLKTYLRPIPVVDRHGEQVGIVTKSHGLYTVGEMIEFIDDAVLLLKRFGVNVPPPLKD